MSEPFINITNLVKVYRTPAGDFPALKGVSLSVNRGEFVAIIGKSGSGKSTLLNTFTGIDHPTSGEVYIGGEALHRYNEQQLAIWRGRNLGIIFQFFQLLPTLTVVENVLIAMDLSGAIKFAERRKRAMYLLDLVGLADKGNKMPSEVSGGEQQRVAIARSLANDPPLLVADEPTGNLDSATAESIFTLFKSLVDEGKTMIMVTHDNDLAQRINRAIVLSDGVIIDDRQQIPQATSTRSRLVAKMPESSVHVGASEVATSAS